MTIWPRFGAAAGVMLGGALVLGAATPAFAAPAPPPPCVFANDPGPCQDPPVQHANPTPCNPVGSPTQPPYPSCQQ